MKLVDAKKTEEAMKFNRKALITITFNSRFNCGAIINLAG
jgi:hypothetical protein